MAILITGGAGYIGSHVNKLLASRGYQTIVFDNLIYGHREAVKWGQLVVGDLKNPEEIEKVFSEHVIDAVIHLAAYAYVGESVENPEKYYFNNVANTLNLLAAMRRHNCNTIVFSSTCAVFGEPNVVPIIEDAPKIPVNPYGASKLMVERIFKDYSRAYGLKFVVLRYFNAAGADPDCEIGESHEPETHLIPLTLDAASGVRSSIKVFGGDWPTRDGSCIRDYIHVADLAQAHLLSLEYLNKGGASDFFNLGNGMGSSVFEVVESVKRITELDFEVDVVSRRLGDPASLIGSGEKAKRILGWEPFYPELDTIVRTAWFGIRNEHFRISYKH